MADEASAPATPIPTPAPVSVALPQLSASTLVHKLTLKLDDSNFLSWKQQVEGIVRTHRLQSFLVDPEIPLRFLSEQDRINAIENPAYQLWEQQDSALFTWLLSSLSPSVLPTVVNCKYAWEVWQVVLDFFEAQSLAQSTQLRSELRTITKGSKSTSDFLKRVKSIVNALITIGDPISYREHLEAIFDGLPDDYSPLMTIVYNRSEQCSISHVEAMIIAHEARLDRSRARQLQASAPAALLAHATAPPPSPVVSPSPATPTAPSPATVAPPLPVSTEVNYASSNVDSSSASDDRSRSGDSRGYGDRGGYNNSGGRGGRSNRGGRSSVQCQICHKFGHDASICYHRGNSSSSGSRSQPTMTSQAAVSSLLGLLPHAFSWIPAFWFSCTVWCAFCWIQLWYWSSFSTRCYVCFSWLWLHTAHAPSGFGIGLFPRAPAQHPRAP